VSAPAVAVHPLPCAPRFRLGARGGNHPRTGSPTSAGSLRFDTASASPPPRRLGFLLLTILLSASPASAATRVVSLNLCTDQLLVLLAPEKIIALSPLARDPALSFVARRAASLPIVRPSAEAVLRLHPDLILVGPYGAQTTVALLQSEGLPVHRITLPQTFPAIRAQTLGLARLLDVPERGAALVGAMNATLAAVRPPPRPRTAIAWEPRGFTDGPATLMGAILRAAGLTNLANGGHLGLEALMRLRPDLLVVQEAPDFPSLATDLLQSPVLASIQRLVLPPALTLCAGPFTAQAVAMLAR
jgi:iron complex transport system substrate-binding protein